MASGSQSKAKSETELLRADCLAGFPWLVHGFSTRQGGLSSVYGGNALNLGFTGQDSPSTVEQNRQVLVARLVGRQAKESWSLVTVRQIHSDLIRFIARAPEQALPGDGLITSVPRLLLAVQAADCLPIMVVDPERRAVGVFHAGWRGTVKRIVEKGIGEMRKHFGSRPNDMRAAIGPGIRACCYQVGPELAETFEAQFPYAGQLFRRVKESDAIREKISAAVFECAPARSQSITGEDLSGFAGGKSPAVARRRTGGKQHLRSRPMHFLSTRTIFLSPRRPRQHRTNDGPNWAERMKEDSRRLRNFRFAY